MWADSKFYLFFFAVQLPYVAPLTEPGNRNVNVRKEQRRATTQEKNVNLNVFFMCSCPTLLV